MLRPEISRDLAILTTLRRQEASWRLGVIESKRAAKAQKEKKEENECYSDQKGNRRNLGKQC